MATEALVAANIFCTYHHIEYTFIDSLAASGLVELAVVDEQKYIPHSQLPQLEKLIRLHQELEINIPGIEAIVGVLQRLEQLQQENITLQNRLRLYGQ